MKQVISSVNGWVTIITEFLQGLIVLGVVIGILFNDYFGVIGGIGNGIIPVFRETHFKLLAE